MELFHVTAYVSTKGTFLVTNIQQLIIIKTWCTIYHRHQDFMHNIPVSVNPVTPLLQWDIWQSLYGHSVMPSLKHSRFVEDLTPSRRRILKCIFIRICESWPISFSDNRESSPYYIWGLMNLIRTLYFFLSGWKRVEHKHRNWRKGLVFST